MPPRRLLRWLAAPCMLLALAACARYSFEPLTAEQIPFGDVAVDLYLIGDAGLPAPGGDPVLRALQGMIARDTLRTYVVYLGDNVYPAGLPDSTDGYRAEAERILRAQIEVLRSTGTRGLLVPGNHDWDAGGMDGWRAVVRQEIFVREHGGGLVAFLPSHGCPGPAVVDVGEALRIVALDTQWWLHEGVRPEGADSPCPVRSEAEFEAAFRTALATPDGRPVVVVAHHPLESGGQHGGYFDWPTYIFAPYPWARRLGVGNQDVTSRPYVEMRKLFRRIMEEDPPLVYAAGHEHNLQVLSGRGPRYHLVSGSGIYDHTTSSRVIQRTLYAAQQSGFMRLTIGRDGRARLAVLTVDGDGRPREDFSMWLDTKPGLPQPPEVVD